MIIWLPLFIFLILMVLITLLRPNHTKPLSYTREKHQIASSRYFDFHGLSCHYTDEGKGETIVMIHGLGDSFKMFDKIIPELTKTNRVIRLDLPGFGLSDVPKNFEPQGSPVAYYQDYMKTIIERLNLKDFHLMGNSLGGLVSWEYALQNQNLLRSLTLISSAGFEMDAVKKNITKGILHLIPNFLLKRGMPYGLAAKNAAMVVKQRKYRTKEFIDTHYDMVNAEGTLKYFIKLLNFNTQTNTDQLHSLKTPTLIVWGEGDKIVPISHAVKFEEAIPNAQVQSYSNCGHYPQIEFNLNFTNDWRNFAQKL